MSIPVSKPDQPAAPLAEPPTLPDDGRQSETARAIARGTTRCLLAHALAAVPEVVIANGRRADLMALSAKGEIWIVEIKSSIEDFRSDRKWPDYRDYCDRFYFAVQPSFPADILPADTGLILADRYGGEILRHPTPHPLPASRRKAVLTTVAMIAASRLTALSDPEAAAQFRNAALAR